MGEVYNAFDERHQRYVALKLLSTDISSDPSLRERFEREARVVAQLRDPHVIPVHGYGEVDGRLYIDMRLVEGTDLAAVLEDGPLPPERAVDIVAQVAGALEAAHDQGLVHRDVKPSNVLVARGPGATDFAYLCDFGIARSVSGPALTRDDLPVGTLAYMAPERFSGGQPAASSDIYALACLLYECLTGRPPYERGDLPQLLYAHLDQPPPRPSEVAGLPTAFDPVIARGMAKDPGERYASVSDLAAAARAALDGRIENRDGRRARTRRSRGTIVAAAVSTVLVAAGLVARHLSEEPTAIPAALGENAVGMVDTATGRLVRSISVDAGPSAVATGFGAIWTVNTNADSVSRIDSASGAVTRILVQSAPSAIAVGSGSVWVTNGGSGTVTRIDPSTYLTQTIAVGTAPSGIAADSAVWVANAGDATVSRIDPSRGTVVRTIAVGASPAAITVGNGVWVANAGSNSVSRIDASTSRVTATIPVGDDPEGIVVADSGVWVSNALDGTLSRIASADTSEVSTLSLEPGAQPTGLTAAAGRLWVVSPADQALDEIDGSGRAPRLVRTLPLAVQPSAVAGQGSGAVWVTGTIAPSHHRGGVLRLRGEPPDTIDPSYGATKEASGLFSGTYDGLVGIRHAAGAQGAEIVPDLATALPSPTNGGRTYTFHLRTGLRWSDGRPLTVADVQRGIERAVLAGLVRLRDEIAGAKSCTAARCSLRGVSVDAARSTVTVRLAQPHPTFLEQIAAWCPAVPADTPLAEQRKTPIAGLGPYAISSYRPGRSIVLHRNPYFQQWSATAQPAGYPDGMDYTVAPGRPVLTEAAARRGIDLIAAGRSDWGDARFAGSPASLSARFGGRYHLNPDVSTRAVVLNTRLAPFDDVRVRRALNLAVDRSAAAAAWPALVTPTCQILPPNAPGYRPYCPYTLHPNPRGTWGAPDFLRAQQLVAASGTRGMHVTVWSLPNVAAGVRVVVRALRQLGYRVTMKVDASGDNYFAYIGNSRHRVQAAFFGWIADYPSGGDFMDPLLACSAFLPRNPANTNVAQFCDPKIDDLIRRATRLEATAQQAADDLWARVDRAITDRAPWVAVANGSWADVVSRRVHGYAFNPYLGVLFDQMWLA